MENNFYIRKLCEYSAKCTVLVLTLFLMHELVFWVVRTDLVPAYVRLLRDNEAEVRIAAAGKVTKFCRILSPELAIQHILPCVKVHMLFQSSNFLFIYALLHAER